MSAGAQLSDFAIDVPGGQFIPTGGEVDEWSAQIDPILDAPIGAFVAYDDHLGAHRGIFQGVSPDRLAIVRLWSNRLGRFQSRNSYLDPATLRLVKHTLDASD